MLTRAEVADRRGKALALRVTGVTWQQIADQLGHKTPGAAAQDVSRALKDRQGLLDLHAAQFVTLELERLDSLERAVQTVMRQASGSGERSIVLRAADRLLRIAERRAALLGLDAAGKGKDEQAPVSPVDELRARREHKLFARG